MREISRETMTIDEFLKRDSSTYRRGLTVLKINGRNVDHVYRHIATRETFAILSTYKGKIDLKGSDLITVIQKSRK